MIDHLEKISLFQNHKVTLKQLSYDKTNKEYMTESAEIAINFDAIAKEYEKIRELSHTPSSNDALYWTRGCKICMIEFKNGKIDSKERKNLQLKIYDSALMLTDLTDISLTEMKNTVDYILVYNETKVNNGLVKGAKKVPTSIYFDEFSERVTSFAKEEKILFGLEKFGLFCHKAVHTYTVSEFEAYLNEV